jgi:hypothetical protein
VAGDELPAFDAVLELFAVAPDLVAAEGDFTDDEVRFRSFEQGDDFFRASVALVKSGGMARMALS